MLKDVEWAKDGTYIPGEEFSPEFKEKEFKEWEDWSYNLFNSLTK